MSEQEHALSAGLGTPATPTTTSPWLERHFQLSARGTSVRQETLAGLTTFLGWN